MSGVCLFHPDGGGGFECAICMAIAIERETVAAIAKMLREHAAARVDKWDGGSGERCLREAADAIERGAWKRGKERGDG